LNNLFVITRSAELQLNISKATIFTKREK